MITKTLFLAKEIHRIGTRSIRDKKSLLETLAEYRAFFASRAVRRDGGRATGDGRADLFS
jgi:hypothetical protein